MGKAEKWAGEVDAENAKGFDKAERGKVETEPPD